MTAITENEVQIIDIHQEIEIDAPADITFEAVLEEIGPGSETEDGKSMNMKIEAWPGGRWSSTARSTSRTCSTTRTSRSASGWRPAAAIAPR